MRHVESIVRALFFFFGHTACGILFPQPGIEHMPPALGAQRFNHWITREILGRAFFFLIGGYLLYNVMLVFAVQQCE